MSQADGSIIIDTRIDQAGLSKGLSTMKGAVVKGVAALTAAIGAASIAVINLGSDFEQANAKASTLFGDAKVNMTQYQGKMLDLSNKTGLAATELGNTMYDALSAGIPASDDMSEAMGFLEKNTKLAKAGFTDINTATTATAKVLNAYKMDVSQTDKIHKVLIQTQNKGITTVNELGSVLSQVTPTAAAMNVSFEQVGASLANMTAQGTPTAQATTQLNQLFSELGKKGTAGQKALEKAAAGSKYAGKSFQELMKEGVPLNDVIDLMGKYADKNNLSMIDMFSSIDAGKAALAVSGKNAEQYTENLKAMKTQTDVVGEAYDKVTDTFKEKSAKVVNSLKNVGIAAYAKFEKPLKKSMDVAQSSVDSLSRDMSSGKLGKSVDKIAKAFGSLIEITAKLASKAIPLLAKGFTLLIDHGKELTIGITAISTAMGAIKLNNKFIEPIASSFIKAKKAVEAYNIGLVASSAAGVKFNGTLSLGQAAVGLLTGQLSLATAAQTALNAVQAVSPMGWVAIGVGALTAGITALVFAMGDEDDAHKKNMEALDAEIKSREELKQKQTEQLDANLGEIANTQSLNNELKNLVDANGKVKKGYEARVSFIIGELNDALGLNMKLTDGEIEGYKELSTSLDDMIAKKRAEIILESQLPAYKDAITKATNAQIEANKLETEISKGRMEQKKVEAELEAKYGEDWILEATRKSDMMLSDWSKLKTDTDNKQQEYDKQNGIIKGYYEDISSYETNAALIASGNADNYSKIQANSLVSKQDTTKGKIEALQQEIQAEKDYVGFLKGEYSKETDEVKRKQIQAQIDSKEAAIKNEQEKVNGMTATIINKGPEYDAKVKELAKTALSSFEGDTQRYFGVSKDKFQKVIDGMNSKDRDVRKKAEETAKGMLEKLKSKDDEYSKQGAYVLDGVINGVNSKSGDVFATMRNFAGNMLGSFKKALGIKSPSREFAKLSKFIPYGIKKGIDENKDVVDDAMINLSENMLSPFKKVDLSKAFGTIKSAIFAEQAKMGLVVNAQAKEEIMRTSIINSQNESLETSSGEPTIINRIYLDSTQLAEVITPKVSNNFALSFSGRR